MILNRIPALAVVATLNVASASHLRQLVEDPQCSRDGSTYQPGNRITVPGRNACQGQIEGTAVVGYDVCGNNGEWQEDDAITRCFDGEECVLGETGPTCQLLQCEDDDGVLHDVWSKVAVPQHNSCVDNGQKLRVAFNECTDYGDWEDADEYTTCPTGEHCMGNGSSAACVPIQCERDGTQHQIGARVPAPDRNTCRGTIEGTAVVGYDICSSNGEWQEDDAITSCFDGEECVQGETGPACQLLQCEDDSGVLHDVWTKVAVPQHNSCVDNGQKLRLAFNECTDYGDWEDADEYTTCPVGEHCVGNGSSAACVTIQCERDGSYHQVGARVAAPERDTCRGTIEGTAVVAYDVCGNNGEWQQDDALTQCFDGEECVHGEESRPTCALLQCEDDSGVLHDVWTKVAVPQHNSCVDGGQRLRLAFNECTDYGDWEDADEYTTCPAGEHCVGNGHSAACVPIQCERDGTNHQIGARVPAPERNTCLGTIEGTAVVAYDVCGNDGEWQEDDALTQCFDGEQCVHGEESRPTCELLQCEDGGISYDVWSVIPVPQYNVCHDSQTLIEAFNECTDYGDWEDADRARQCPTGQHCVEAAGSASCVPL